jgi:hypothetical protein
MKNKLLIFYIHFIPFFAYGQFPQTLFDYAIGDSLQVLAKSGLTLRDSASMNGKKITAMPFGSTVVVLSPMCKWEVNGDRMGGWLQVSYNGHTGYAFSGFLTSLKIPALKPSDISADHMIWFETIARANTDSLIYKGNTLFEGVDQDEKERSNSNWEIFRDGTLLNYVSSYEETYLTIESYEITLNDILNLLEYYTDILNEKYFDQPGEEPKYRATINIIRNGSAIKRIECERMHFSAENFNPKNFIRFKIDG